MKIGRDPKQRSAAMTDEPALQIPGNCSRRNELEELHRRYAPQGIRYAFSMLRNRADAEEVTQEAFCRLWAAHPQWQEMTGNGVAQELQTQFPPLFFTTIRNQCIDQIRKRQRQRQVSLESTPEPVSKRTTDVSELDQQIVQLLSQLPDNWADALKLKVNGRLSYAEIASVLGATHAQVRTWIYRARRRLAAELEQAEVQG